MQTFFQNTVLHNYALDISSELVKSELSMQLSNRAMACHYLLKAHVSDVFALQCKRIVYPERLPPGTYIHTKVALFLQKPKVKSQVSLILIRSLK